VALVLTGAFPHRGVRVCAHRIGHVVRRDRERVRVQGRRRLGASVHRCIINGHDYGELLYSLGVMGWLMLVTIPGGLVAFVSWLIFLILHCVAWRKRVSAGTPPPIPPPLATA
jgi:hypothetical protein